MKILKNYSSLNDPFAGFDTFFDQFSRGVRNALNENGNAKRVTVDVYEQPDSYEVRAELPGVQKEDVSIEVEDSVLSVKAKRVEKRGDTENEVSYARKIAVGDDVDSERVEARLEDGILTVKLAKEEKKRPRTINVN